MWMYCKNPIHTHFLIMLPLNHLWFVICSQFIVFSPKIYNQSINIFHMKNIKLISNKFTSLLPLSLPTIHETFSQSTINIETLWKPKPPTDQHSNVKLNAMKVKPTKQTEARSDWPIRADSNRDFRPFF